MLGDYAEEPQVAEETDLSAKIVENAEGPAQVTGDQGSVSQHKLPDQIAADRYLRSRTASRQTGGAWGNVRKALRVPGGAQ